MQQVVTPAGTMLTPGPATSLESPNSPRAAASWPAIFAGAFVAVGATLILIALGSGIGFASISPWSDRGVSATTFAVTTAIWLLVTQWISAALGGYIAGRLRHRWVGTHSHEVFFRDTAHGLITWAVATVLVVTVVTSSAMSGVGAGAQAASHVAGAGAQGAMMATGMQGPGGPTSPVTAYGIDKLFRPAASGAASATGAAPGAAMAMSSSNTGGSTNTGTSGAGMGGTSGGGSEGRGSDSRAEVGHIMANAAVSGGDVADADRTYLVDQVAMRTGVSQAEAQSRVDSFLASVKQAQDKLKADADAARKAASEFSIYLALSLVMGAFIASVSAALGGRLRDEHI